MDSSVAREKAMLRVITDADKDADSDRRADHRNRRKQWEDGWLSSFDKFRESGYDTEELEPYFPHGIDGEYLRWKGEFIKPLVQGFQKQCLRYVKHLLFRQYFKGCDIIVEFGCGTCINIVQMARMYPKKEIVGLDWADASVKILDALREKHGMNVRGYVHNMRELETDCPVSDEHYIPKISTVDDKVGVLTCGSMEQLGDKWRWTLKNIRDLKPEVVVHIEPIVELYGDTMFDYTASRYDESRGYLSKYYPHIQENYAVELCVRWLGNLHHEGSTVFVWRPL
jgi:hypothetical protein